MRNGNPIFSMEKGLNHVFPRENNYRKKLVAETELTCTPYLDTIRATSMCPNVVRSFFKSIITTSNEGDVFYFCTMWQIS